MTLICPHTRCLLMWWWWFNNLLVYV